MSSTLHPDSAATGAPAAGSPAAGLPVDSGSTPVAGAKTPVAGAKKSSLQRLRAAARDLFVQVGYHDTRPQDIARHAGVANGTFYLHFADKQQAFLDFSRQAQDELLKVMSDRVNEKQDRRERWKTICGAVIDFDLAEPGLLQAAFLDPVVIAPKDLEAWRMYDRLGHLLSLALVEDEAATEQMDHSTGNPKSNPMDHALISHGICGMLRHALIYAGRNGLDRQRLIEDLSRFIDQGLTTAEGS